MFMDVHCPFSNEMKFKNMTSRDEITLFSLNYDDDDDDDDDDAWWWR